MSYGSGLCISNSKKNPSAVLYCIKVRWLDFLLLYDIYGSLLKVESQSCFIWVI